jgi:hypothetical protein
MSLRATLNDLASTFATDVLTAIRGASLEELVAESGGARRGPGRPRGSSTKATRSAGRASPAPKRQAGRLARRSPADIANVLGRVHALLKGKKAGLRSEQIQKTLRLDKRELPRVLADGLAKKKLSKKGQKRATAYFAR